MNLAVIAGGEHLTTLFADFALDKDYLAEAEPRLRKLFE